MNEELVSIRRLAQVLDCSPKTVRDWMYKNRRAPTSDPLPYYRVGGLVRFRMNEIMTWIDRRRIRVSRNAR
jgi:predicted DNA-binding transcriptional regulator AlpA